MVNDITIIGGIIAFFIAVGFFLPIIQAELGQNVNTFDLTPITDDEVNDLEDSSGLSSGASVFEIFFSVVTMFFWTFGSIPAIIDALIFIPLRLLLVLIIARNVWVGGGRIMKNIKGCCPVCQQEYKILRRCRYCYKLHCNLCTTHGVCKECFVILHQKKEIEVYFDEKYNVIA